MACWWRWALAPLLKLPYLSGNNLLARALEDAKLPEIFFSNPYSGNVII